MHVLYVHNILIMHVFNIRTYIAILFTLAVDNEKSSENNVIMFHVIDPNHNCYHSRSEVR